MFKKFLASVSTIAIVASLVITPSVTAFAEDNDPINVTVNVTNENADSYSEPIESDIAVSDGKSAINASGDEVKVTVNGDVSSEGTTTYTNEDGVESHSANVTISADNGATVNVENVTTTDGGAAVSVNGEGTTVNVNGNIDASGAYNYINSSDGKEYPSGANGAYVNNSANLNVEGNVIGASSGIHANDNATVSVGGDVRATGADNVVYTWNKDTEAFDIPHKTVTGGAVWSDGDANITIEGNVLGVTTGVGINPDNFDDKGSVTILGTINDADGSPSLFVSNPGSEYKGFDYDDVEDALDDVPDITIYESVNGVSVHLSVKDDDENHTLSKQVTQEVINAINYIIKQDDASNSEYGISVSGDNLSSVTIGEQDYKTVNIEKAFQVAAKDLPSGYTISGGQNVSVVENSDGSYTLTLKNSAGGINIKAVLRPVPAAKVENLSSDSQPEQQYTVEVQEVTPSYADPNQAPAGAIVVANTAASTAAPEVAAISGNKPARTVSYNIANVTPQQYKASIIENVAVAPAGGALNIETDRVACFDTKMIQAFAARPDIDVNVVFNYGGKKMKVVIPAGYNVASLLDEFGYCGFLRLLSILGGTEL